MTVRNDVGVAPYNSIVLDNTITAAGDTPLQVCFVNERTTGIGHPAQNAVSIIANGVESARATSATFSVSGLYTLGSIATNLSAQGTTFASATPLTASLNFIASGVTQTGCVLPSSSAQPLGACISIFNDGAGVIRIYAQGADTIDGVNGSTGVPLTNAKRAQFITKAANTWISTQLGAVSS